MPGGPLRTPRLLAGLALAGYIILKYVIPLAPTTTVTAGIGGLLVATSLTWIFSLKDRLQTLGLAAFFTGSLNLAVMVAVNSPQTILKDHP